MTFLSPAFKSSDRGFTLIEVLMVIAILSVITVLSLTPLSSSIDESRFQQTMSEMKLIRNAMLGDKDLVENGLRTSYGYLGDMGGLPTAAQGISALITNPGLPAWTLDTSARFGRGWNGPYLSSAQAGTDFTKDAWGRPYAYSPTASPPTLVSYGADGVAGGTGFNSDITVQLPTTLQMATVYGFINQAGSPYTGTATVELNHPDGTGALATATDNVTATEKGAFSFTNIPLGTRSVTIYIPSKAAATQTFGPIIINIDTANYVIPSNPLDIASAPGATPTPGPGATPTPTPSPTPSPTPTPIPCASNMVTYVAGSTFIFQQKTVVFSIKTTAAIKLSSMKVTSTNSSNWTSFFGDNQTASCSGGNSTLSPCPVAAGVSASITPTLNLTSATNKMVYVGFASTMTGSGSMTVQFKYDLGCDNVIVTGL